MIGVGDTVVTGRVIVSTSYSSWNSTAAGFDCPKSLSIEKQTTPALLTLGVFARLVIIAIPFLSVSNSGLARNYLFLRHFHYARVDVAPDLGRSLSTELNWVLTIYSCKA